MEMHQRPSLLRNGLMTVLATLALALLFLFARRCDYFGLGVSTLVQSQVFARAYVEQRLVRLGA